MKIDIVNFTESEKSLELSKKLGFDKLINLKDLKVINGKNEESNRKALEKKSTIILMNPHLISRKDHMHFRRSGLNHILCKLATKNNILIGFSLDACKSAEEIGRVMQNIRLCRKFKTKMIFCTLSKNEKDLRSEKDLESFCKILGMAPGEAKKAFLNLHEKIINKK